MFDDKDLELAIYEEMRRGASADDIADIFSKALNNSLEKVRAEKEKETKRNNMYNEVENLLELSKKFLEKYYGEYVPEDIRVELTADDIIEMLDYVFITLPSLTANTNRKENNVDKIIADFLSTYNL